MSTLNGSLLAQAKTRKASLHAVVTRADGTKKNYGMVAYYHWFAPWRVIVNTWIGLRRTLVTG